MAKKRIPAFPLPVVRTAVKEFNPDWKPNPQMHNNQPGYYDGYTHEVIRKCEVLTVNFQSGTMRVRAIEGNNQGNVYDTSASDFFVLYKGLRTPDEILIRVEDGENSYTQIGTMRIYDTDDLQ